MKRKISYFLVAVLLAFTSVVPASQIAVSASETPIIVDDNVTTGNHYFTFLGGVDDWNGVTGWSDQPMGRAPAGASPELISQHWVWNDDGSASNSYYTFTFKGTGVELMGIPNDKENSFQMDEEPKQTLSLSGSQETVLYSRKDLAYGEHTVTVSLPANKGYTGLQISYAKVYGSAEATESVVTTVPNSQTDSEINKFTYTAYAGKGWAVASDESYIDLGASDARAEECFYELSFVGNAVEIIATKSHNHGIVKFTIDGGHEQIVDLYNSSRLPNQAVYKVDGLSEGEHTLRATTQANKNPLSKAIVNQVQYAKVTHAPYLATDFSLDATTYSLSEGATQTIVAKPNPAYATLTDLVFSSNNEKVATVSSKGVISAQGEGTAVITVESPSLKIVKTIAIEVVPTIVNMSGSIVDTDTQYTQDRYDEVSKLGLLAKDFTAWKNDKVISEIALIAKECALKNVTVSASDFKDGNNIISKDAVETTFIKSTKAYNGNYLGYGSTTRPIPEETANNRSEANDILYQSDPIDVVFNGLQNVWVEINIPKDAKPGTYTGTISITADKIEEALDFTYTVEVKDATLKDASAFKDSFDVELWQYPYSSAEYYDVEPFSSEHLAILDSIMELYKEAGGHAITATIVEEAWAGQTYSENEVHYPSMVKWIKNNDGSFTYDYTDFDKWVSYCKTLGIGDKIVLYSIAPWHNSFTYWENDNLKYESYSVGSARYTAVWTDFLQSLVDHLMAKGWFDEAYIGIDERGFSGTAFDTIEKVKNIHGESLKTAGAMDNLKAHHDLAMRVTDLNVGDTSATENAALFAQLVKERDALGMRTTLYSCTEHHPGNFSLSAPVESYWMIANDGKIGGDGYLRWAYDAWVKDPLRDTTHNSFEPGDCFLIYPDEKDAINPTSKGSIRLEKIAEGVRDVNKLKQIEADIPGLANDIANVYATINGKVATARNYLTEAQINNLITQKDAFKASLDVITDRYITLLDSGSDEVESIAISEGKQIDLAIGSSKQLHVDLKPTNLINTKVTWTSSSDVVSVDNNGMMTANKAGKATITVTSQQDTTKSASIIVNVIKASIEESAKSAYYSFNGSNVEDEWGSRNGSVNGASFVTGKEGKALSINEVGQNAKLNNTSDVGENWSVGYWVYNTNSAADRISPLMSADGKYSFDLRLANNRPKAGVHVGTGGGDVLTFSYDAPVNVWIHMTWTQDKTKGLSLYVNGKFIQTNGWTVNNTFKCPIDTFGAAKFTGLIDDVKVYNRVLTPTELATSMMVAGLNVNITNATLFVGETVQIETDLISDHDDKTITYTSDNHKVATVSADGKITAVDRGNAKITVENKAAGFKEVINVKVSKKLNVSNSLTDYRLPEANLSVIDKDEGGPRQYLGQPDMVMMNDHKTLITAYPVGHGKGPLVLKISKDAGETWVENKNIPVSWKGSQETPTMFHLNLADGTERIILITACPGWGTDSAGYQTGWNTSYSDDGGETWNEYTHWYTNLDNGKLNKSIVAMASLVQLKDADGNFIQKWLGVYHDYDYINYKTYLTFDENGNEQWSKPVPYLSEYRKIESTYQMCEIGMFRSPDGNRIVGLARSQSHNNYATLIYSDDEGETWSEPMDLPGSLAGERHKAMYDPVSGRLLITFREIKYDINGNGVFESNDWLAGDWIAWVGTYEQLMNQDEGDYRILIAEDFSNNAKSGDTGYAGIVVQPDGTFIMDSYGHWDKDFSLNWQGGITTDLCYIKQAKFKLSLIDNLAGLIDRDALETQIKDADTMTNENYTVSSWAIFENALARAKEVLATNDASQKEIDAVGLSLKEAITNLIKESEVIIDKTALVSLIEAAEELKAAATYTPETLAALNSVIVKTQAVIDDASATEAQVKEAYSALETAIKNLVAEVAVNKDALATQIEIAKSVIANKDNYVASTIKGLEALMAEVEVVFNDEEATQAEVNAATKAITTANMKARVKADKVALADIIAKVNAMDLSKYTEASVKALQEVAAKAQKVMDNEAASQIEVDASIKNVEVALQSLEVKTNGGSGSTSGNTTGGTNTKDTTNVMLWMTLLGGSLMAIIARKKMKNS